MIVSHRHRFIFFAVPRTASHSVRTALAPHLDAGDWQQQSLEGRQVLPISELARAGHGHIGVRALRPHLTLEQWDGYFKFAIVRHPYDRFVSACAFLNRDNSDFAADPVGWMRAALERPRFQQRLLIRPQVYMLADHAGQLAVDFAGRFEQLPAAIHTVGIRTGLAGLALPHRNRSSREAGISFLTPELRKALYDYYRADFDGLNFSRDEC